MAWVPSSLPPRVVRKHGDSGSGIAVELKETLTLRKGYYKCPLVGCYRVEPPPPEISIEAEVIYCSCGRPSNAPKFRAKRGDNGCGKCFAKATGGRGFAGGGSSGRAVKRQGVYRAMTVEQEATLERELRGE